MREPPKSNAMPAIGAGDDWDEDEVIDPATGVWEGQCPRCYVDALEGSHTSTNPNNVLACCHCGWRLDKHQRATPIGQNGRKVCKTCRWFERCDRGAGKCLAQRLVPLTDRRARWVHPTVLEHERCDSWRLLPRRRQRRKPKKP